MGNENIKREKYFNKKFKTTKMKWRNFIFLANFSLREIINKFQNPRNRNWIGNQKRGEMPTFWIICCWRAETGQVLKRLLLQRTNEDFQTSWWHKTNKIFYCCRGFFLLVCLMGWNTQVWFVCIWSCSEESQVRMSMNLDRELQFGF